MKTSLFILIALLLPLVGSGQTTYIFQKKTGATTTEVEVTPQNSKAFGLDGSGNLSMLSVSGASTLAGLSDVAFTDLMGGHYLQYNSETGKWSNVTLHDVIGDRLHAFYSLEDGAGVLTNDGEGVFTYTGKSTGGNGAADAGKVAIFGAGGQLQVDDDGGIWVGAAADNPRAYMTKTGFTVSMGFTNQTTLAFTIPSSGQKTVAVPHINGTIVTTGDTGTVTNTMLAGSIDLASKVAGLLPLASIAQGGATSGQALAWNGTAWAPATITGASPAGSGSELQYRSGASTFGAVTGSSVSGGAITLGTGLIINAASGFTGKLIDAKVNGTTAFSYTYNSGTRGLLSLGSAGGAAISIYADPGKVSFASSVQATNGTFYVSSDLADSSGAFVSRNYGETTTHFVLASDGDAVAATMQLGLDHANTPTGQTIRAHDVTTGTGASLTLAGGKGSVAGGDLVLATSTTNGAATARLTVKASGVLNAAGMPTSSAGLASGDLWNDSGTVKIVP